MNKVKLSFIIPVYNGELYLRRCLDNLLMQDIEHELYEIICVNDCSTDASKEIILEYKRKYSNIVLINHEVNSKVATACNTGLQNAKGKYLWIRGQDDIIETNCLGKVLSELEQNSLDLLLFNYQRVDKDYKAIAENIVFEDSKIMNGVDFIHHYFGNEFVHYLLGFTWRAVISSVFIKKEKIVFKDGMTFEDTVFLFKAIVLSNRLRSINDTLYFYRENDESIMHNLEFNMKGDLIYEFAFEVGDEVMQCSKEIYHKDEVISKTLSEKAIWYYTTYLLPLIKTSLKEKINFYSSLRKNRQFVNEKLSQTSFLTRLFAVPCLGFCLSLVAKPIYLIKKKIHT